MTEIPYSDSARAWDKTARKYAKSKIADAEGYERSISRALDLLSSSETVLELGCGTGTTGLRYAPNIAHYTGTDISREMIAICREKLAESALSNVTFQTESATALSFPDESFSAVIAHNLMHLVGDVPAALAEIARVLEPGGMFISKTPCLGEMAWPMRKILIPLMARLYGFRSIGIFTIAEVEAQIKRQRFDIEASEFHASKGKDMRPFIVARKPLTR